MSRYRRAQVEGGTYFFTVTLTDRSSDALVQHVQSFRDAYRWVQEHHPFDTVTICVLPDHPYAIWTLPDGDTDFSTRWSLIKARFSRGLAASNSRSTSKIEKRDKGIWQRRFWDTQFATRPIWAAISITFTSTQ
jgi:putative transposase